MTNYVWLTIYFSLLLVSVSGCQSNGKSKTKVQKRANTINCTIKGCSGVYSGPEFVNDEDVAHQFSNQMANQVGKALKAWYQKSEFIKVDLENIKMTTKDMDNKGEVIYTLNIPFVRVLDSCLATTAFDHRGGWGHKISEKSVKRSFMNKKQLDYKEHTTPEGLQEFWIQWQHQDWQKGCD
ncbi:MAG: hypothetical protein AB8B74_01610 [Crocinitomicaceae bacterium]